jgi:hypothetical protein
LSERLDLDGLEDLAFDDRNQHGAAMAEGDLGLGQGDALVGFRHKLLAADAHQHVEHAKIQHLPGADLLLDHVEPCLFEIHCVTPL